ncbi:divergent protein kinase domain 1C-like [Homarus americanus]|uniref:Divergent protein kinase domain 1C-like n=1 Tax=Homarus americanus TaxID=6706 RepID=A0A8J5KFR8_HOMAM|nr:divergent protein kinase domain 1C-like [Homarus americanus]KAG7171296.1 Divergent protein kinase domain 1C-like [Homarus americanus]
MKITFLFSCCIAKLIDDMLVNRRKRRRCIFWSVVVGSLVTVFIVVIVRDTLFASKFICSTDDIINNHITELCEEVKNDAEQSDGHLLSNQDLCKELCVEDLSSKITCHKFHLNKPAVFTLDNGRKKVVKSVIKMEDREEPIGETSTEEDEVYWKLKSGSQYFPSKDDLLSMSSVYINNFIGNDIDKGIIIKLMNMSNLYHTETETLVNHVNFWLLLQDNEFLTSLIFEKLKLFPSVLRTCGTYYAMQYLEPLTENPMLPFTLTWRKRLWKALDIIKYVGQLETIWKEPLHLCDVKHDHFGWDDEGKVMFLDLDAILPETSLLRTMENTPHCSDNDDCSYFDCKGRCHHRTSKCELDRSNTNLQVICDKIFLGNTDGLFSLYGLLVSHEANEELSEALELCKTNRGMTVDGMIDVIMKASNVLLY